MNQQPFHAEIHKLGADSGARLRAVVEEAVPAVAPALAVSIWQAGAPWYEAYAGWVDPEAETTPVGFRSLFDLASLSKLFTATAVLRLASDFRLDLDEPVVSVIPELGDRPRGLDGGQDPLTWEAMPMPPERVGWTADPGVVTFRQLLTHTSGLAPWRSLFRDTGPVPPPPGAPDPVAPDERAQAALAAIGRSAFVARPGEEVHYSDLGYMLLGVAVARTFRRPLPEAMQALIRDRLGLDSLTYTPVAAGVPRESIVPTELDARWRGRRCWGEVHDENAAGLGGVAGHAGLFASAHDVARFGVAWLRADPRLRLQRFLRAAVTDQTAGMAAARGLGWQVQPADFLAPFSEAAYGHTGFTGTSLVVDARRDLVVALCTNRVYHGREPGGIERLRRQVHALVASATEAGHGP